MIKLICINENKSLAKEVSDSLKIPLAEAETKKFSNGELYVRMAESVRGCNVFIIHAPSENENINESILQLLLLVDACRRSSSHNINVVMPHFYYSRQDKQGAAREPVSARVVADMLTNIGVHRLIFFDLHAGQIQGFFNIPADNLTAIPLLAEHVMKLKIKDLVVVSPDTGGVKRARRFAKLLNAPLAIIDKRRPKHNVAEIMHIIGDIEGKNAILVDDIIDTAGTICSAADALIDKGAKSVNIVAVHGIFSGNALEKIEKSSAKKIFITNTITKQASKKIEMISVANLVAEVISRIEHNKPLSDLFDKPQAF